MPETIYHYTDATGLQAILESGEFRATSARSLNDRDEYVKGREIVENLVNEQVENFPRIEGRIWGKLAEVDYLDEAFVISFTDKEDDLGMWRGYATGGFSLGLRRTQLEQYLEAPNVRPAKLGWVAYETEPLVESVMGLLRASDQGDDSISAAEVVSTALFYKGSSWESESEIRWAGVRHNHDTPDLVLMRPGRFGLTRFITIPANPQPYLPAVLESITVGPGPFQTESLASLDRLRKDLDGRPGHLFSVKASTISLR